MVEIMDESRIRDKNEVTIPIPVRSFLKVGPGDRIRWELGDDGCIIVCKVVSHKVNNRCCKNNNDGIVEGGENGKEDTKF